MVCTDCNKEKVIEEVNISIFKTLICSDCVDERENMMLAKQMKERFEFAKKHNLV
jgi:hypothetical protein